MNDQGVRINETIEAEITRRSNILSEMNKKSNWTKEMEKIEAKLEKEIDDLIDARNAYAESCENEEQAYHQGYIDGLSNVKPCM